MAILTKAQLQAANSSSFPNNNSQAITPQILRDYNSSVIDTLVDSLDTGSFARTDIANDFTEGNNFTSISASAFVSASNFVGDGSKLTNITASTALPILDEGILQGYATSMNFTGSAISAQVIAGTAVVQVNIEGAGFVTTASFNGLTQSFNEYTQSTDVSINALNQSTASQQISINALNVFTASQSTASIENSITELNAFTASQEIYNNGISNKVTALEIATASLFTSISNLNQSSASQQVSINNLNTTTASLLIETQNLELFSASALTSLSNLNSATSSLFTSASLGLTTASISGQTLTFSKGDGTTFGILIPDVSGSDISQLNAFTASQELLNTTFATTASNSFIGNQTITGQLSVSSSAQWDVDITGGLQASGIIRSSGSLGAANLSAASGIIYTSATSSIGSSLTKGMVSSNDSTGAPTEFRTIQISANPSVIGAPTLSGITNPSILTPSSSTGGFIAPIQFQHRSNFTDGRVTITTPLKLDSVLTASLQEGYVWVGGTGDITTLVSTSSFGGTFDSSSLVTTASFNSYTSSNDQRVSSLEAATSSYITESETASFARTDIDNNFTANQTFTNITAVSASFTYVQTTYETSSIIYSSGSNQFGDELIDVQTLSGSVKVQGSLTVNGTPVLTSSVDISGLTTTASFNAYTQSNDDKVNSLINATASYATSAITASSVITASAVGNTITFTKGDASTFNVSVVSTPIETGSFATTGSNTFIGDQTISGSLFVSGSEVVAGPVTASKLQINGITDLNGTLDVSNDATFRGDLYIQQSGNPKIRLRDTAGGGHSDGFDIQISTSSFVITDETHDFNFLAFDYDGVSQHTLKLEANRFELNSGSLGVSGSLTASLQEGYVWVGDENNKTSLVATSSFGGTLPSGVISGSAQITALGFVSSSVTASSLVTASVNLNTITFTKGDNSTFQLTVDTGSGGGGGAAFPYVGDAQISGSLGVTGSMSGFVNTLTIASNTASMDFNNGNFFTLQLVSGSITHLAATNIRPGQTINLLVKTDSGSAAASGSLTFSPTFKFAGGFDYTPTQITASQDLVSFVTFDTTQIFAAQIKNLS